MSRSPTCGIGLPRGAALAALGVLAIAAALGAPPAGAETLVSTNWAGYVAGARGSGGYSSVSGTWVVPSVTCAAGRSAYSAAWVGLGGYRRGAQRLEQVGTDQDCARSGAARYDAWFELLPAGPVYIPITVHAGDRVSASTTVAADRVTMRLRDLSTGARFSTTRRVRSVDVSTAEWIVEAPSDCASGGACDSLPLADFGVTRFLDSSATVGAVTRAAGAGGWPSTALELQQEGLSTPAVGAEVQAGPSRSLVSALPSAALTGSGAFSVTWTESSQQAPPPAGPTLPGFGSG